MDTTSSGNRNSNNTSSSSSSSCNGPILYHVPKTISSPIYQVLMELNLVDNPIKVVTLTFPELKTLEHLQRNPMGTSPTFVDEQHGISIWESGAVLTYLLEMYDYDCKLYPKLAVATKTTTTTTTVQQHVPEQQQEQQQQQQINNNNITYCTPADRAKFLHIQQYIIATVYPFVASLYLHVTLKPKQEQDENYIQLATEKWKTLMAPTLVKYLGDSEYFMGNDKMTAIDLLVAKPFHNAHAMGLLSPIEFPTLVTLYNRIRSLPSFAKAYNYDEDDNDNNNNNNKEETSIQQNNDPSSSTPSPSTESRSMLLLPSGV